MGEYIRKSGEEPPRLRFDTHEDALRMVAEIAKNAERTFVSDIRGLVERYIRGEVHVKFSFRLGGQFKIRQFMLLHVPFSEQSWERHCPKMLDLQIDVTGDNGERFEIPPVFLGVCQIVEGPEGILRSGLWMEPYQDSCNIGVDIERGLDFARNPTGAVTKREFDFFGLSYRDLGGNNRSVDSIIQDIPDVCDRIKSDGVQCEGNSVTKSDLMQMIAGLKFVINELGVLGVFQESGALDHKLIDVCLRPFKYDPRSGERVFHHEQTL